MIHAPPSTLNHSSASSSLAKRSLLFDHAETFAVKSSDKWQWKRIAKLAANMRPLKVHGFSGRRYRKC
jgi:hypothetical protein